MLMALKRLWQRGDHQKNADMVAWSFGIQTVYGNLDPKQSLKL